MELSERIRRHYRRDSLEEKLLSLLLAMGKKTSELAPDDLVGLEDMHVGGREATRSLAELLEPQADAELLDLGSGLGGPARYFAFHHGCRVIGVDLTAELVETAASLTRRVGLADRVRFEIADVCALPFADGRFDAAYSIHVGMNVADKARFYRETARVLRPRAFFAICDVLKLSGEPDYPVPWAEDAASSFLAGPEEMQRALEEAGFELLLARNRTRAGAEFMRRSAERLRDPQALRTASAPIVMGPRFRDKIGNLARALEDGRLGVYELLARRRR